MLEIFKQTGPELRFKSRDALLAIVNVGGMRDHGPHLGSAAELRLLEFYSNSLKDRFYPYVFLTPGVTYSTGEGAFFALAPEVVEGLIRDVTLGVKSLGIGKVMGLTFGRGELEALKKGFEAAKGIKTYAFGIWEFYPHLEELDGEDPLSRGGPYLTSQLMHVDKNYVKEDMIKYFEPSPQVPCDPRKSSPELGRAIVEKVLEALFAKSDELMRE
jgi:creatinine amidohydrolase/Fe(II)-dependent formamide hydrolase-like protein